MCANVVDGVVKIQLLSFSLFLCLVVRYVKEWLGAMVSGKIVSMDVSAEKYWIPNHHKCVFQTGSKLHKAVVETLGVPMLCTAFYDLIECFKLSGPKGMFPLQ